MNFIKHNKVFTILFTVLLCVNVTLFYLCIFPDSQSAYSINENSNTSTSITTFNGSFSDARRAIELSWNITSGEKTLTKLELYQGETLVRDVTNSYSTSLGLSTYGLSTGNNQFTLRATFDDESTLEKSLYVYVNEAYAFEATSQNASDRTLITLHYYYDKDRSVGVPSMSIDTSSLSANYVSSRVISDDGNTVEMEVVYELLYGSAPRGAYNVVTTFTFANYNLSYDYSASFTIATQETTSEETPSTNTDTTTEEEGGTNDENNTTDNESDSTTDSES